MKSKFKGKGFTKGFSLIELMIVVALIAVISAVAFPSYSRSVLKSKRQIGKGELMAVVSRQEQFFVNNKAYATDLTTLGYGVNPYYIDEQGDEAVAASSIYQVSLVSPTATAFSVRVTPQNNQSSDSECASMQLSSSGLKTIVGGSGTAAGCW